MPPYANMSAVALKKYEMCDVLGHGSYGTVWRAKEISTQKEFAIKAIKRQSLMSNNAREQFRAEVGALATIRHTNVVSFKEVFEDATSVFIVTEVAGQELYECIVEHGFLEEKRAKHICRQMLAAIGHLHQHGYVHRDIKPENVCLGKNDLAKLIDFGLCVSHQNKVMGNRCGSYFYVAPEVLDKQYSGGGCDVWSVGVVLFVMLVGYPPFYGESDDEIAEQVKTAAPDLTQARWQVISDSAKRLVLKLLVKDPHLRVSAKEALSDPWFEDAEAALAPTVPVATLLDTSKRRRSRSLELASRCFPEATELTSLQCQLQQCQLEESHLQADPACEIETPRPPQPPQPQKQKRGTMFRRSFRRKVHSVTCAP